MPVLTHLNLEPLSAEERKATETQAKAQAHEKKAEMHESKQEAMEA